MPASDKYHGLDAYIGLDAMNAYMKGLASRLPCGGRAKVRLTGRVARGLNAMASSPFAEKPLSDNIRWISVMARQVYLERAIPLPACLDTPRVSIIAGEIISHSDFAVTQKSLYGALEAFDSAQGLTMDEIWLFPRAVIIELIEAFFSVAKRLIKGLEQAQSAREWVEDGAKPQALAGRDCSFYEQALKSLAESGRDEDIKIVENWLNDREGVSRTLARAQESRSKDLTHINNIISSLRLVSGMNWQKDYESLCRAEKLLLEDGVYAAQDEASKVAIRREVARVSKISGLGEWTVVRHASRLAAASSKTYCKTLVYWLYDRDGQRALRKRLLTREDGKDSIDGSKIYLMCFAGLFIGIFAVITALCGPWLIIPGFVLSWRYARLLLDYIVSKTIYPRKLLKLKLDNVPKSMSTLVVIPALLSSVERVDEICRQLEALAAATKDDAIEYLLLGDFRDSPNENEDDDERIVARARYLIDRFNARDGVKRYHYLHRARSYVKNDLRYMARERKRGALMALNELILGNDADFLADGSDKGYIKGRFKYVCTLDADARMLPDHQRSLIGAMAHPLNRLRIENGVKKGYGVISPRVEQMRSSRFSELVAFPGGLDAYTTTASSAYWDLCERAVFCGKGIYDVKAFNDSLKGVVPDYAILSHDLLEGALCRAGLASDVVVIDDFPKTPVGYLKRLNRWTRGDWQLLPYIFTLPLEGISRFMMLDNLISSLTGIMSVIMLVAGIQWGIWAPFIVSVLEPIRTALRSPMRALANLAFLPQTALTSFDAAVRAVYRVYKSRKGLLDWTPASDVEGGSRDDRPGKVVGLLMLPGLFHGPFAPFAAALGLLFWAGGGWLGGEGDKKQASDEDKKELFMLAAATWRYFETAVSADGNGLPPDNIQIDPYVGAAMRSSPTNIAMYMLSCLSASLLGIISEESAKERIKRTLDAVESMPKWNGHLYNWYSISTAAPLNPKYVSSVDSGNLAAGLMLLAATYKGDIGERCEALARGMDFTALYDTERKLFYIGLDASTGRVSDSHYDLLASESRILSLVAIALGQVEEEHFQRLGRAMNGPSLLSWSGTMFEYLMPELFTPSKSGTLLHQSNLSLVRSREGERMGVWGVSESGYYAFDSRLNYQYRAFGLNRFSLSGARDALVIAPYATLLALSTDPDMSLKNLKRMKKLGWMGDYGFYEAVDFDEARIPAMERYRIVKSYMTHHQGMIMVAIANFLTDGALSSAFCSRADIRAYLPLLEQRPFISRYKSSRERAQVPSHAPKRASRRAALAYGDGHLLEGGGTTVFVRGDAVSLTRRANVAIDRFSRLDGANDGTRTVISVSGRNCPWVKGVFSPGEAKWSASAMGVTCSLLITVSSEDGAAYRLVELENMSGEPRDVTVVNAFAVELSDDEKYLSHPAFANMFVKSELISDNRALFIRKGRDSEECPAVICCAYADQNCKLSFENDLIRLIGRRAIGDWARAFPEKFTFTSGYTLNPCMGQKAAITLKPGEKSHIVFSVEFSYDLNMLPSPASNRDMKHRAIRAGEFARARVMAALDFLSMDISRYHVCDRASVCLFNARYGEFDKRYSQISKNDLWSLGLDVVYPIIAAFISREDEIHIAREAADRYHFYGNMGVRCELALVCDEEVGYARPVTDALTALASSCHVGDGRCGEVRLIQGRLMSERARGALIRCAAIIENDKPRYFDEPALKPFSAPDWKAPKVDLSRFNGYGGFAKDASRYIINTVNDFPAPWCNILANETFGVMLTERFGGFAWLNNSRLGRITPWTGDSMDEGGLFSLYVTDVNGESVSLVPALPPASVVHTQGESSFESSGMGLKWTISATVPRKTRSLITSAAITNLGDGVKRLTLNLTGNFLMGADSRDARMLCYDTSGGFLYARGAMPEVGFIYLSHALGTRAGLIREIVINPKDTFRFEVYLGAAADEREAVEIVLGNHESSVDYWNECLSRVNIDTPDAVLNSFVNRWLPYQTISSRLFARAGFYQAGGAFGFRDQLQDMLLMTDIKPEEARRHIVRCAQKQFESGDVLHWWHPPATGVRTRISDDCVFLPYVVSRYVLRTGDRTLLETSVPFLSDEPLPDDREDIYIAAQPSREVASIREHCLRAIYRASRVGNNGLAVMGGGDWNDGMNAVKGESVWLSEFLIAVCDAFSTVLDEGDPAIDRLRRISEDMKRAVEEKGWDGSWYLRAFYEDGQSIGGEGGQQCQIDLISQSWAVLAGLNRERCVTAMDNAWKRLFHDDVIRLLTPPFVCGEGRYPGYIADYPPGVRENGGQYTHAACWGIMAWAALGQSSRAWKAFNAILPYNHAASRKEARRYKVEPYVMAADVYQGMGYSGRGGWTWYTGAASWAYVAAVYSLMGLEVYKGKARLCALLPSEWKSAGVTIRVGGATYRLISKRGEANISMDEKTIEDGWIELNDDGREHVCVFPARAAED